MLKPLNPGAMMPAVQKSNPEGEVDWAKFEALVERTLGNDPFGEINVERLLNRADGYTVGGLPPCSECYGATEFRYPQDAMSIKSIVVTNEYGEDEVSFAPLDGVGIRCAARCGWTGVYGA